MQDIPHISGDMAKLWDMANEARGRTQDPLQTPQPHSREASVQCTAKIKTRDDKRMDKSSGSISGKRARDNSELAQLIIAVTTELVYVPCKGELLI